MRRVLSWLVTLSVPIVLTMALVRVLTLPWYPVWEYGRPGFPEDPYGLSQEDRLRLAQASIRFLNIQGPTSILADLALPNGMPAHNERELDHMDDVKRVYGGLTLLAAGFLAVSAVSAWHLRRSGDRCVVWQGLTRGAVLTLALLVALGSWMLVAFDRFFTLFHGVFFQPGTWTFFYTDTLIRLFPFRFWEDAGLLVAGGVTLVALALLIFSVVMRRRCRTR
ncbi:MAG: TIGR01906 family membrane protein [Anaerolineae bacterium]|nr:TIGR01906 family membrane protein [Anaerolineae bacterium]